MVSIVLAGGLAAAPSTLIAASVILLVGIVVGVVNVHREQLVRVGALVVIALSSLWYPTGGTGGWSTGSRVMALSRCPSTGSSRSLSRGCLPPHSLCSSAWSG